MTDILINIHDIHQSHASKVGNLVLCDGDILVEVEKFAFTSNNISYASTGHALGYWKFFPSGDKSYGRIPCWGFAIVRASRCAGILPDMRIYGYFPMSSFLVLKPAKIKPGSSFKDSMPHRKKLPAAYNEYSFISGWSMYDARYEEQIALLHPLFATSWLLDDFLTSNNFFGANTVVLSSASSKTSIGLAYLLSRKPKGTNARKKIIALTSRRNVDWVHGLHMYDSVVSYGELLATLNDEECKVASLGSPHDTSVTYVDMAGNVKVLTALHQYFGVNMQHSCLVGATHVDKGGRPPKNLPGAKPKFFFAPAWIAKRVKEWNIELASKGNTKNLFERIACDWKPFLTHASNNWLNVNKVRGEVDVLTAYNDVVSGRVDPSTGIVMSLPPICDKPKL